MMFYGSFKKQYLQKGPPNNGLQRIADKSGYR